MQYGKDWFKTWFNTKYYHILYEDRNYDDAQFFIDNIINELQTSRTDKILDVACGRGRHSIYLSKLKYNVTGIDLSTNNINYAKKAAKKLIKIAPNKPALGPNPELNPNASASGRATIPAVIPPKKSPLKFEKSNFNTSLNISSKNRNNS